uniref:Uncharacterized protein n=1 Tax=Rhizophora mucronata TaxID=61149 RepID=A0A2P2PXA9_RHIMU
MSFHVLSLICIFENHHRDVITQCTLESMPKWGQNFSNSPAKKR